MYLLSLNEGRPGIRHPETLKSHLWLFTVQLAMGDPTVWQGTLEEMLSQLRHKSTLSQRIVDSIEMRQEIMSKLSRGEYYLEAVGILRDMLFDLDHYSPACEVDEHVDSLLQDVLTQLRGVIEDTLYDTTANALTKESPNMESLRQRIQANVDAQDRDDTTEETIALSLELVKKCSQLFGKEHEQTVKAAETLQLLEYNRKRTRTEGFGTPNDVERQLPAPVLDMTSAFMAFH